jgi:aminoglycoside-2''-adenylyltransferase
LGALERLGRRLHQLGFEFRYVWDDETWWVHDRSWSGAEEQPTAFVYSHADGRKIDIHGFRLEDYGGVTALWTAPYELTGAGLDGRGVVAGQPVRCLTAELHRSVHTGNDLPPHHAADLQRLSVLS